MASRSRPADLVFTGGSVMTMDRARPHATAVAVRRVDPEHREREPFLPDEALDLETALRAYTMGGAWANHSDDLTGSIEAAKLADLVVLDRNVAQAAPESLGDTRAVLTLVEGEVVWEDTTTFV